MAIFWIWRFSSLDCENQRPPAASGVFPRSPPLPLPLSCLSAAMSMRQIGRRGGGGGGGGPLFGHKTLYYGYQGDGYGPLRGHKTMLLPREILHLGPSGPPGALVGSIGLLFKRANTGKRFCCPGQGRAPPDPLPDFQREQEISVFFYFVDFFCGFARGKLWPFFGFAGSLL